MAYHSYRSCLFALCVFGLVGCDALAEWHQSRPNEWDAAPAEANPSAQRATAEPVARDVFHGVTTWYGPGFHGRQTASGERFDMYGLTAAHKTLPFGTRLRVVNPSNGKSVVVRVNDRGPFVKGKVLDLSKGAAKKIGLLRVGTARMRIEVL